MKTTILILSVICFSISVLGQKKTASAGSSIYSETGLEGFDSKAIDIGIEDYSDLSKNFPMEEFKNLIELRARQGGLDLDGKKGTFLLVFNAVPAITDDVIDSYSYDLQVKRFVNFTNNNIRYSTLATVWQSGGRVVAKNIRRSVGKAMDLLLLDTIKANKKKEVKADAK